MKMTGITRGSNDAEVTDIQLTSSTEKAGRKSNTM